MSHSAALLIAQTWINTYSLPRLLGTARCACDFVSMSPTKIVDGTTPPKIAVIARPQKPMSDYGIVHTAESAAQALAIAESRLLMKHVNMCDPLPITSLDEISRTGVIVISHKLRARFADVPGFVSIDHGLVFGALDDTPIMSDTSNPDAQFMDDSQVIVFEPYSVHFDASEIRGALPGHMAADADASAWTFAIELALGTDSNRIKHYELA